VVTQNQLQTQIIQLQQTLLGIHQDYMLSTYLSPSSSHSHLARLIQTTRSARLASIQALHMQYQRMLPPLQSPEPFPVIPGAFPLPSGPMHRHDSVTRRPSSRPRSRSRSESPKRRKDPGEITIQPYPLPHPKDPEEITIQPYPLPRPKPSPQPHQHGNKLFCIYARDLQHHARLPLTDNYKPGGNNMCPYCHSHISTRPGKAWEIILHGRHEDRHRRRVFLVKNRFVIKSHREGAGFACVLCATFKESDTVCREVGALMEHLWKDHTCEELEKDDDIFEVDG
jgi:hypothetical protein